MIYEYHCPMCGIEFEAENTVAKRETAPCPICTQPSPKLFLQQSQIVDRDWDKWQEATGWQTLPNKTRKIYPAGRGSASFMGIRVK